jgi:hypothetical protein
VSSISSANGVATVNVNEPQITTQDPILPRFHLSESTLSYLNQTSKRYSLFSYQTARPVLMSTASASYTSRYTIRMSVSAAHGAGCTCILGQARGRSGSTEQISEMMKMFVYGMEIGCLGLGRRGSIGNGMGKG